MTEKNNNDKRVLNTLSTFCPTLFKNINTLALSAHKWWTSPHLRPKFVFTVFLFNPNWTLMLSGFRLLMTKCKKVIHSFLPPFSQRGMFV